MRGNTFFMVPWIYFWLVTSGYSGYTVGMVMLWCASLSLIYLTPLLVSEFGRAWCVRSGLCLDRSGGRAGISGRTEA